MLKKPNTWIMLSNADRRSSLGPPYDDARPFARLFIEAAPDRCIWGTDWPHIHYTGVPPNDADLLELLYRFAGDDRMVEQILVRNPDRLWSAGR
jgi:predicted TIM-barrel fold metal-dependent hydrolase